MIYWWPPIWRPADVLSVELADVDLSRVLTEDNLCVHDNSNLLFQAIGNILDSAIKYSPQGGIVKLATERTAAGEVVVCISSDNGAGIPADQRQNVLQRFVGLSRTAETPGLGQGLSFAKAVADVHQSSISFEDAAPGLRVWWRFAGARA